MTEKKKSYFLPILMMFVLFFTIAFVTNIAGSMGVIVKSQFGTSNALSQLGSLANFVAYAVMGIPAGLLIRKKGYKFTALTAVLIGLVGVAIQFLSGFAESFLVYIIGAFIAGIAVCMLNTVVNPMLNTLGGGGNKGNSLIQYGNCFNSLGAILAPYLLGFLIGDEVAKATVPDATPVMIIAMSVFVVVFIVLFFTSIPEPHIEAAHNHIEANHKVTDASAPAPTAGSDTEASTVKKYSPFSFTHFVLGIIAIFCYVGIEVGVTNTANLYMSNELAGPKFAGIVISMFWFMMLIGRFMGGLVGKYLSSKNMLIGACSFSLALIIGIMAVPESVTLPLVFTNYTVPVSMICMVCVGLFLSVMWGAIFNLATEGLGKYTPIASGIFMTFVVGGGILPFLQNLLADIPALGYTGSYIISLVAMAYILSYGIIGYKNRNKEIPV